MDQKHKKDDQQRCVDDQDAQRHQMDDQHRIIPIYMAQLLAPNSYLPTNLDTNLPNQICPCTINSTGEITDSLFRLG